MRTNPRIYFTMGLVAGVLGASLSACSTIESEAETVFRRQNQVSSALMQAIIAAELDDPDLADRLYDQEDELLQACRPLQKAGYQNLQYGEVEGSVKFAVLNTLRTCAIKSNELADMLRQVDPVAADGFLGLPKVVPTAPQRPLSAMARQSPMR